MHKRIKRRKLNRTADKRKAFLKIASSALLLKEKIKTTEAKAKEIQNFTEKQITLAKTGNLAARRLSAKLFPPKIVKKLIQDLAPRYKERKGGYTRIIKLGPRKNDGAKMAIIELVK